VAQINIYHLYPGHLNLYGDRGNMLAFRRRAEWHGIALDIIAVEPGDSINFNHCDLLFMGGGQDSDQKLVASDLARRSSEMRKAVEDGMAIFAVCGSYQLLGNYYTTHKGERIGGLKIIDLHTEAGEKRLIGNAVINCSLWDPPQTLVGFENHAGKTFLGPQIQHLGEVLSGYGNNGLDKKEGAVYKNVIGTYLHGSLLPKNPWLTDYLLQKALDFRNQQYLLKELDDAMEQKAHETAINLAGSRSHKRQSTRA
jgi:lipid II isoglutaminyl synthase (glutamine-hydrolysing)